MASQRASHWSGLLRFPAPQVSSIVVSPKSAATAVIKLITQMEIDHEQAVLAQRIAQSR